MDFFAQLIFYGFFWAIGVAVLNVCSLGRIVPTALAVKGTYERLPTGKIAVKADYVACIGILAFFLAIAVWVSLLH